MGVPSKSAGPRTQKKEIGPYNCWYCVLRLCGDKLCFEISGTPSSVSLDDSLASTSIPEHVKKMTNMGVNPSSTFKDAMASSKANRWNEVVKSFLYGELDEEIYMDQLKGFIAHVIEHKDMGEVDVILGTKLIRSTDGITISQSHYVEKIMEKFGVLRYQKGTVSLAIHYVSFPVVLEGYSDASWIVKNSCSNGYSGNVLTLGVGAISWKFAKPTLITPSTFKAELCKLDTTGTEA
ncbi:UNVERIFIED_CONTAM: hypothetical protein Scaly_0071000 [Sesamum calycinum]|uniref:Zinc finger, CCHC-type n=1 Tax=Sesamum calycinum TaxID=2727403 RepID=A0AAW2SXC3_9LAMI